MAERTVLVTIDGVVYPVSGRLAVIIEQLLAAKAELAEHPHCQLRFDLAGQAVRPSIKVPLGPGQRAR